MPTGSRTPIYGYMTPDPSRTPLHGGGGTWDPSVANTPFHEQEYDNPLPSSSEQTHSGQLSSALDPIHYSALKGASELGQCMCSHM